MYSGKIYVNINVLKYGGHNVKFGGMIYSICVTVIVSNALQMFPKKCENSTLDTTN